MGIQIRSGSTDNGIQVGGVDVIKINDSGIVAGGLINASTNDIQARTSTSKLVTPANLQSLLVSGTAVASTSGTFIDFTGIPSWVKRITVMFSGFSISGTSTPLIRLGTSGGFDTTGYVAHAGTIQNTAVNSADFTAGFPICNDLTAASIHDGTYTITLLANNIWTFTGSSRQSAGTNRMVFGAGSKSLSGILDRIRITQLNGTDTFDAGTINIMWE